MKVRQVLAILFITIVFALDVEAQNSSNVSLFGSLAPVPFRYSGSWGYTAPGGEEYAILGGNLGTYVIAIDDSTSIQQIAFIAGPQSNWREITVLGTHAYVVTEGSGSGSGMQVMNLGTLPDTATQVATYTSTFTRGHIISRDIYSDSAYVYISGTSTTSGVHILDVSTPVSPVEVGLYRPPYYIHDAHIRGNRMYASALGQGLDIVDISDKTNPTLLRKIIYPSRFTHSCWTTDDHRFIVVADEVDGLPARIWNIEDLDNIYEVSQYSANLQSLVHNPYIRGDLVFIAHNTEGLRVVDIADPSVPVEVGFYDTYAGPSGGFNGLWSAYPYFPSRKIIGGDRTLGLLIWKFNETRAGRMYGIVTDSVSGQPIASAQVRIVETDRIATTDSAGVYRVGEVPSTTAGYTVAFSAPDYITKYVAGVPFSAGDSLWLSVQLVPTESSVDETQLSVEMFVLFQNYPNPFNPSTTIQYTLAPFLPHDAKVTLVAYDQLGREVQTLVDEIQAPGSYEFVWDATSYGSGVYFLRMTVGRVTTVKKVVLLR